MGEDVQGMAVKGGLKSESMRPGEEFVDERLELSENNINVTEKYSKQNLK